MAVSSGTVSASLCILAKLRGVKSPFPVMVLAEKWPSALISVLALDLPLDAAYFPARFHQYFKPRDNVISWQAPNLFTAALMPVGTGLLLAGSVEFLE